MRKLAFITLLFLATASSAHAGSLGPCIGRYSRVSVWIDMYAISQRDHGVFNPDAIYVPFGPHDVDQFHARYGVAINNFKGDTVGERYSETTVTNTLSGASNPCPEIPPGYTPDVEDREDLVLVSYPPNNNTAIYDTLFTHGGTPPSVVVSGPSIGAIDTPLIYSAITTNCTPAPSGWTWLFSGAIPTAPTNTESAIALSYATEGSYSITASNPGCGSGTIQVSIEHSGINAPGGGCQGDTPACGFSVCSTPAASVPSFLWGQLQPADLGLIPQGRDDTGFDDLVQPYGVSSPQWMSLDASNGYLFAALGWGLQIIDIHTTPSQPVAVSTLDGSTKLQQWASDTTIQQPLVAVAAANDTLVALGGKGGIGTAILDSTTKTAPRLLYQDAGGSDVGQIYAASLNGTHFAFSATSGAGLVVYNLDAARAYASCLDHGGTACPGVFLARAGVGAYYVHGVDHFVAISHASAHGFDIYDVTQPATPVLVMSAMRDRDANGIAMWAANGHYYLATRSDYDPVAQLHNEELYIYDVTCITASCPTGPTLVYSHPFPEVPTAQYFVTFSRSNGTPFLYLGSDDKCSGGAQREWLLNVADPASPVDVTPSSVPDDQGGTAGYWGWYYRGNDTGFNSVMPRIGKFVGPYFYRAAMSILDVHQWIPPATAPTASFTYTPGSPQVNQTVTFTDTSTGNPTSHVWTFPSGSPSTAATSPITVRFGAAGAHVVSLSACNTAGCNATTQTVTVHDQRPAVQSLAAAPNPALIGQVVTLTAQATGAAPLNYTWRIAGGPTLSGNPAVWNTAHARLGTKAISLIVSNAFGSASANTTATLTNSLVTNFAPVHCVHNVCIFKRGTSVSFQLVTVGHPTVYEYDWSGNGTFAQSAHSPIAQHVYQADGIFRPRVRVTEGSLKTTYTSSLHVVIVSP